MAERCHSCTGCGKFAFSEPTFCWGCRNPRTPEERVERVAAGVHLKCSTPKDEVAPVPEWERAQELEEERRRIVKRRYKKRRKL